MDTSAISYRVADFLKKHLPFQFVADEDLLELAGRGRVRFHEANDYISWQGEPHKLHVSVIQHGTVSLWEEADGSAVLRDVRGAGDMLGIERFSGAPHCLYSARSATDVVIYAFPAADFEELILKYPHARQFVEADDTVATDYQSPGARDLQKVFLKDVIQGKTLERRGPETTIREAAEALAAGADAIVLALQDDERQAVVTADSVLAWVAGGGGDPGQPAANAARHGIPPIGSGASIADAVMAMAAADAPVLALTADGSSRGRLHSLVTASDVARAFGDSPVAIAGEIRRASRPEALARLNHRARAAILQHLTGAPAVAWLAPFASLADSQILRRVLAITAEGAPPACWCFAGTAGRQELLTRHRPQLLVVSEQAGDVPELQRHYERVGAALAACGYLDPHDSDFDAAFHVAARAEWQGRFGAWLRDPVQEGMHRAREFFDLRPVHGADALWRDLDATVAAAVNPDLLYVLANDCLASLPPLTFYEDAVIDDAGETSSVFRLEHSALQPLVDVGRLLGMAAKRVLGTSTRERFASARTLLPEHELIFREASDTLSLLLWQQGRVGISQGTTGAELPPALLSRSDRHVLKSGFRSIQRLIEFVGNSSWLATA